MGRYGSVGAGTWKGRRTGLAGTLVALVAYAAPGWAASASAPIAVSATVVRSCVIRAARPGLVEVGCVRGATAAPVHSSADVSAARVSQVDAGAATSRGPVVRERPSADGVSVLVTVDF
jgi:hypothetical protein